MKRNNAALVHALASTKNIRRKQRPSVIVISDWLANCRAGQWTPFEAAAALKEALIKEGYEIVATPNGQRTGT